MESSEFWWMAALCGGTSVFLFIQCFSSLHRANLMRDIPTSRIRSAAQGYVELEGTGGLLDGPAIVCPLTGTHCLWWKYSVHRKVRSGKRSTWRTVRSGTSDDLFFLDDGTGRCIIDPDGAQVIPTHNQTWYGSTPQPERGPRAGSIFFSGNYRYREELIQAGGAVYAIGQFRTQQSHSETDFETAARELLAEWKEDQPNLLKRFDVNGDGQIDAREWEATRRVAHIQVRRDQARNPPKVLPGLHIMSRNPGRPYLLSGINQQKLTRRLNWKAASSFLGFLAVGSVFLWLLSTHGVL